VKRGKTNPKHRPDVTELAFGGVSKADNARNIIGFFI
jgi:hypothetical protein